MKTIVRDALGHDIGLKLHFKRGKAKEYSDNMIHEHSCISLGISHSDIAERPWNHDYSTYKAGACYGHLIGENLCFCFDSRKVSRVFCMVCRDILPEDQAEAALEMYNKNLIS